MNLQIRMSWILGIGAIILLEGSVLSLFGQKVDIVYTFTMEASSMGFTNADGASPNGLALASGTIFGAAAYGGHNAGSVFCMSPDGSHFRPIYLFSPISDLPPAINADGARPSGGVIVVGNTLYGTGYYGGNGRGGVVFGMDTNGVSFRLLHYFTAANLLAPTNHDGFWPLAGVVSYGGTLFGTTSTGGSLGGGTVFSVANDGSAFQVLHNLNYGTGAGALIISSNILYGTTVFGGTSNSGSVFGVSTDGASFFVVHNFGGGGEGSQPRGGLTLTGSALFGTTSSGGSSSNGTVFRVNTDGSGFITLHSFSNIDGANPIGTLLVMGTTLFGTTAGGGKSGNGTVFSMNLDGTMFTKIHDFTGGSDGADPGDELLLSGGALYGTTRTGGDGGSGTVFLIMFQPELSIYPAGGNVVLSWPTNYAGFDYSRYSLQSSTNIGLPDWVIVSSAPVVINGQNTITNTPSGGLQTFFRLKR